MTRPETGKTYFGSFSNSMSSSGLPRTAPIGTVPSPIDSAAAVAVPSAIPTSTAPTRTDSKPFVISSGVSLYSSSAILARLKSAQNKRKTGAWSIHGYLIRIFFFRSLSFTAITVNCLVNGSRRCLSCLDDKIQLIIRYGFICVAADGTVVC